MLGRVLWRRELWDRLPQDRPPITYLAGMRNAGHVVQADQITVRPVTPAAAVDVFGAMPDPTPRLAGWLSEQERADEFLGLDKLDHPCRAWWCAAAIGDAEAFLDATERMSDEQWAAFRDRMRRLVESAEARLHDVPVETRVKAWLAARGDRERLEALVVARRFEGGQLPTSVRAGTVYADLDVEAPEQQLTLAEDETPLRASLRSVKRLDDTTLELRLFAFVDRVGLEEFPDTRVRLVGDSGAVDLEVEPEIDPEATRLAGSRWHDYDRGAVRARVGVGDLGDRDWRIEVTTTAAGVRRGGVVEHYDAGAGLDGFVADGDQLTLRVGGPREHGGPRLAALDVRDDVLHLTASGLDGLEQPVVRLRHPRVTLEAPIQGGFTADVPLRVDEWGLGEMPAVSGRYRVELTDGTGGQHSLRAEAALTTRGGSTQQGGAHRVQLRSGRAGRVDLVLGPPLTDDELGPYRQQRLQTWYAEEAPKELPVDRRRVYFQSYDGRSATDSPLAIYMELRRRQGAEDLDLVWAVADAHAWTPEGARRVLWRSRDWYAALATSAHVVTNIELERWYRSRPGQRVLQTFHGYPSKTMGIGLWRAKGFTESRIEQQLDRTSRNWDVLLTPAPEMDRHYREQYRYDGEILAAGYPRDDALVALDAEEVRSQTRGRLGIAGDQTAVLYAPTWRDDLAVNFRSARMGDHLDLPAFAEALGPEYVVLVRGHRFHARGETSRAGRSSRLVDVTDYPEINHLLLAADAAVLDFSSLRFDLAQTGKPMVFLVPDLDDYTGGVRGFLYDFRDTAPGPLAQDQAEVVAALRDLDGVRDRYWDDYERFNATYNYLQDGHAAARVVDAFFGTDLIR